MAPICGPQVPVRFETPSVASRISRKLGNGRFGHNSCPPHTTREPKKPGIRIMGAFTGPQSGKLPVTPGTVCNPVPSAFTMEIGWLTAMPKIICLPSGDQLGFTLGLLAICLTFDP